MLKINHKVLNELENFIVREAGIVEGFQSSRSEEEEVLRAAHRLFGVKKNGGLQSISWLIGTRCQKSLIVCHVDRLEAKSRA